MTGVYTDCVTFKPMYDCEKPKFVDLDSEMNLNRLLTFLSAHESCLTFQGTEMITFSLVWKPTEKPGSRNDDCFLICN